MGNLITTADFISALQQLTKDEQHRVWDTVTKFHADPRLPGLRVKKMKTGDYYEVRASQELRIIARLDGGDLCCYHVGHHDDALRAGERGMVGNSVDLERARALIKSGALPEAAQGAAPATEGTILAGPLAAFSDDELADRFAVPLEWIATLRTLRTLDHFLAQSFEDVLDSERWYALAEQFPEAPKISTGAAPTYRVPSEQVARLFADGQLRQLQYNLPASSWALIERAASSPVLVRGGPGSGKSLVGIYRSIFVLQNLNNLSRSAAPARVLYVTFTNSLVEDARDKFQRLLGTIPEALHLSTVDALAARVATHRETVYEKRDRLSIVRKAIEELGAPRSLDADFSLEEIELVIGNRSIRTLDEYLGVKRKGRSARLAASDRRMIWRIYERYRNELRRQNKRDRGMLLADALDAVATFNEDQKYDLIVVDEIQDLAVAQIQLLLNLAKGEGASKHVMLIGDTGQSIYRAGFKWIDVGIRVGGGNVFKLARSERSTVEILAFANALVGPEFEPELDDVIDLPERHGSQPKIITGFHNVQGQAAWAAAEIAKLVAIGQKPGRLAIIARTIEILSVCAANLRRQDVPSVQHGDAGFYKVDAVKLVTAHSAKGLEFQCVFVVGADAKLFPLPYENLPEDERLQREAEDCKLLYVCCTRARTELTLTATETGSKFLPTNEALFQHDTAR